jgi:hypothetical protein
VIRNISAILVAVTHRATRKVWPEDLKNFFGNLFDCLLQLATLNRL